MSFSLLIAGRAATPRTGEATDSAGRLISGDPSAATAPSLHFRFPVPWGRPSRDMTTLTAPTFVRNRDIWTRPERRRPRRPTPWTFSMTKLLGLTLATTALLIPGFAKATRLPTAAEGPAIYKVIAANYRAATHAPASCIVVGGFQVSTVDARYAIATPAYAPHPRCARYESAGDYYLAKRAGRWRLVAEGSDRPCKVSFAGIPVKVVNDLDQCAAR